MLDKWTHDIAEALFEITGGKFTPEIAVTANDVLFSMVNSHCFNCEFLGATLHVLKDGSGMSWVDFPEYLDPDTGLEIRPKQKINVFNFRFEDEGYFDDEDNPIELIPFDETKGVTVFKAPIGTPLANQVKEKLRQNDYYRTILEEDSLKMCQHISALNKIEYQVLPDTPLFDIENMTGMSYHSHGNLNQVFGHRYANDSYNRYHVIARNKIGVVGILCFFDHAGRGAADPRADWVSIAYISVSPGYRRHGIAKELLRRGFEHAIANNRLVARTAPSEFGREASYQAFTDFVAQAFPGYPFLEDKVFDYIYPLHTSEEYLKLDFKEKAAANVRGRNYILGEAARQGVEIDRLYGVDDRDRMIAFALNHMHEAELRP
ncbi:GNAT family N-acetyltransferase [Pseudomonas aeruginosa]